MSPVKTIEHRLYDIIENQTGIEFEDITKSSRLVDDLDADSLDLTGAMLEIEQEFDITIADEEMQKCETVGDLLELVQRRMG